MQQKLAGVASITIITLFALSVLTGRMAGAAAISMDIPIGDAIRAVAEWVHHQPSAQEVQQSVPTLATKLAILAGSNRSLSAALLSDGPANTQWMYDSFYKIRDQINGIFRLIDSIDPDFGSKNSRLLADLEDRMNEKVLLMNKIGQQVNLDDPQVRHDLGQMLAQQAEILIGLSDQIATALQPH